MKTLLCKIFFWDAPAQGAFFGMTLLLVLPWLWLVVCSHSFEFLRPLWFNSDVFSYYHPLIPDSSCTVPNVAALIIGCYTLFLILRTLPALWRNLHFTLRSLLLHVAWLLLLVVGTTMLVVITATVIKLVFYQFAGELWITALHIHGSGGFWVTAAGVMALVVSYIIFGRILSSAYGIPFRNLICRSVRSIYAIVCICYAITLVLALQATAGYKHAIVELSEFHGRPMDCVSLGELYFHGEKPSVEFWTSFTKLSKELDERKLQCGIEEGAMDWWASMPDELYAKCKDFCAKEPSLKELEALLERPLPPNARDYDSNKFLAGMMMSELSLCRQAARIEMLSLRFAIDAKDAQSAKRILRRMDNLCRYQQHDSVLIGSLVWIALETMRFDAISHFISSGLADEAWLQEEAAALDELEPTISKVHRLAIYSEAVFGINAMEYMANGNLEPEEQLRPICPRSLRWFAPQMWRLAVHDATELLKAYVIKDFSDMEAFNKNKQNLWAYMLGGLYNYNAGTRNFPQMIAQTRITRGLIEAELYKIHNGHYPDVMDNLGVDPFSGQTLKYKFDECEIIVNVMKKHEEQPAEDDSNEATEGIFASDNGFIMGLPQEYDVIQEKRTMKAVKIWSVGLNRTDDNGVRNWGSDADDPAGMLILNP